MHKPTAAEIQDFIARSFSGDGNGNGPSVQIDVVQETFTRLHLPSAAHHLRPGASISGPVQMALADTAAWALVLHNLGFAAAASVTSSLNINFLSRPGAVTLVAEGNLLKLGKRLSVSEVRLFSEGKPEPVAHATVTYAVFVRDAGAVGP